MTRKELENLFSMTFDSELRLGELQNSGRVHAIGHIQTSFVNAAIEIILGTEDNGADVQRRLVNHLWKAYVIAMACQGMHVISCERIIKDIKIPNALGKKTNAEAGGDANRDDIGTT